MIVIALFGKVFRSVLKIETSTFGQWATEGLISLMVTIVIAIISYLYLERPFLRMKSKYELIKSRPLELQAVTQADDAIVPHTPEGEFVKEAGRYKK